MDYNDGLTLSMELTRTIYSSYPEVWLKLCGKKDILFKRYELWFGRGFCQIFYNEDTLDDTIVPFNMVYGLLEDFFEKNNYYINIEFFYQPEFNDFRFKIINRITGDVVESIEEIDSKNEAKYKAILKATELLNKEIKK